MKTLVMFAPSSLPVSLAAMLAMLPLVAAAQQGPLTGQMMGGRTATAVTPATTVAASAAPTAPAATVTATTPLRDSYAPPPAASKPVADTSATMDDQVAVAGPSEFHATQVGDTARHLLQMQADDNRAGHWLPILGDEASASYSRYIKSFSHDIPEFYESSVGKDSGNGSGG